MAISTFCIRAICYRYAFVILASCFHNSIFYFCKELEKINSIKVFVGYHYKNPGIIMIKERIKFKSIGKIDNDKLFCIQLSLTLMWEYNKMIL